MQNIRRRPASLLAAALSCAVLSACTTNERGGAMAQDSVLQGTSVSPRSEVMFEVLAAELAGRRGMLDAATENYLSASAKSADVRIAERATKLAVFSRQWDKAAQAAGRWSTLDPDNLESWQLLGQISLYQGDAAAAEQAFLSLIERSPDTRAGVRTVVSTLLHESNFRLALDVMQGLSAKRPDSAMLWFGQARLQLSADDKSAALQSVERSLMLDDQSADAILLKGQILAESGRAAEGYDYVRGRLDDLQDPLVARLGFARMLVQAGRYDEASREFEVIAALAPDDANAMFSLGLLAIESRRTEAAEDYLERVLELGEYQSDANYYLARIADNRGEIQRALIHYEAVQEGDNVMDAHIRAAELVAASGDLDEGRTRIHRLRMINTDPRILLQLVLAEGRMLRDAGDYTESLSVFGEGLQQFPDNVELLYAHALTAERLGLDGDFEQDLRRVIELEPDNAHALNALGYFLVDKGHRLEEAEVYLNKAISLLPEDPAIIDSLGWLRYRQGDHEQAIALLRRAFSKLIDPEIAAHLGEVLWVTGDEKSAQEIWNKGLEKQPDDGLLRGVMERYIP
ncbi:tetratricopeptide repeat protein [Granulosicoccaceae sp. 1_MG-2023]|nr:tetratricopeptide repeat protein [Granulosicoccaceae sp. 1_MG-2023]